MIKNRFNRLRHLVRPWLAVCVLGSWTLTACDTDDSIQNILRPVTTYGNTVAIGNGSGRSFVTVDAFGKPTEIGMRLSEAALTGLPPEDTNPPAWYVLNLPATTARLPFNHLSFDWNPHGHEPALIYDTPHFDVHFYMISLADRQQIMPNDPKGEINPESKYLPATYIGPPGVVPTMGKHWVDPTSREFNGQAFTHTFIYGSYNGNVIFQEPMITLAYLQGRTTQTFALPQPQAFARTGLYYPTKYTIGYNAMSQEYTIMLHDMVLR